MTTADFEQLRRLIGQGELALTLERLTKSVENTDYSSAVTLLSARHATYRKDLLAGVTSAEENDRRRNTLAQASLALLEAIEQGKPFTESEKDQLKTIIRGKNIVGGNISNVGGDVRIGDNTDE